MAEAVVDSAHSMDDGDVVTDCRRAAANKVSGSLPSGLRTRRSWWAIGGVGGCGGRVSMGCGDRLRCMRVNQ